MVWRYASTGKVRKSIIFRDLYPEDKCFEGYLARALTVLPTAGPKVSRSGQILGKLLFGLDPIRLATLYWPESPAGGVAPFESNNNGFPAVGMAGFKRPLIINT